MKLDRSLSLSMTAVLAFSLVLTLGFMAPPVKADTPTITEIVYEIRPAIEELDPPLDNDVFLIVTINHQGVPPENYVDMIELEKDGVVTEIGAPAIDYQTAGIFKLQLFLDYEPNVIDNPPTVRVRARSNVEGWGEWSDSVVIPEFSSVFLLVTLAVFSGTVVLLKRMNKHWQWLDVLRRP